MEDLIQIVEGRAKIYVPNPEKYKRGHRFDPRWAPVFYNPKMRLNRTISVLISKAVLPNKSIIVDLMSGTGIRGIRYALEVENIDKVIFNDINKQAVELVKKNINLNDISNKAEVYNQEATKLLRNLESLPDLIDIDPFGSPSPFIESAIYCLKHGSFLAITATDLGPLTKDMPSSLRKYFFRPDNCFFQEEVAIRGLILSSIRAGAVLNKSARPMFSLYAGSNIRIFYKVERSKRKSNELLNYVGYGVSCNQCGLSYFVHDYPIINSTRCKICNGKLNICGPIWIGELYDERLVRNAKRIIDGIYYSDQIDLVIKIISLIEKESEVGTSNPLINLEKLASIHKTNTPPINKVIECLNELGIKASKSHINNKSIRVKNIEKEIIDCSFKT